MDDGHPRYVGAHEIRDMLGVSRQRVYQLAAQPGFPEPVATLAQGKIWLIEDVEAWIRTHRTPGPRRPAATSPDSPASPPDQPRTRR